MTEEQREKKKEQNRLKYLRNKQNPEWVANRKAYQERLKHDPAYKEKMRARAKTLRRYPGKPEDRDRAIKKYRASEHGKKRIREYKQRVAATPKGRMEARIRCRVCGIFKRNGLPKSDRTFNLVGCSSAFLQKWLEKQFLPGMTFDNRQEWHIDHRIPLSLARNEEELRLLCHYSNLQPLWATENIRKHCRHGFETVEADLAEAAAVKEAAEKIYSVPPVFPDTQGVKVT